MGERLKEVEFNSFVELMKIIDPLVNNMTSQEFLGFIDNLDQKMLKRLIKNPKESNRMNFLMVMLQRHTRDGIWIIKKILKLIGFEYFDYLMNHVINNDGYINIHVLEFLVYINNHEIKHFLNSSDHNFKFDFGRVPIWDFHLILYVLLLCFSPEELMIYLERNHRDVLINNVLPKMSWFSALKMSKFHEVDMKHFITAFLLEEIVGDIYFKNLKKLGLFLTDIMLSELSSENNENKEEINLKVIRALDWVGGEAERKLNKLSNTYDIDKYRELLY